MKEILQYSNPSNIFCRSISLYTECSIYLMIKLCSYPACVRGRVFFASVFMHFDHRWKSRHISVDTSSLTIHGVKTFSSFTSIATVPIGTSWFPRVFILATFTQTRPGHSQVRYKKRGFKFS